MKVQMNETRKAILDLLKNSTSPMTLQELSNALNIKVSSGTTNPMVAVGWLKTEQVEITYNKVRQDNGAVIGTGKTTINAYSLGEVQA